MSKTPVSELQEGLMKAGKRPPVYTEVSSIILPHKTEFIICVTTDKYAAKGTGSNKKEAKQNAAKAMIKLLASLNFSYFSSTMLPTEQKDLEHNLQSSMNLSDSSPSSSSNSLPTRSEDVIVNYVGSLMEFCVKNRMAEPTFQLHLATGASHNPTFTMSCRTGTVFRTASATTKKAAKQAVAKEVLQHLEVNLNCNSIDCAETSKVTEKFMDLKLDFPIAKSDQEIEGNYAKLKNKPIIFEKHIKVQDYHILMANMCKNILKSKMDCLRRLYQEEGFYTSTIPEIKTIIGKNMNAPINMLYIKSRIPGQCIIGIRLATVPPVVRIAMDKTVEKAEKKALHQLLEYITFFRS